MTKIERNILIVLFSFFGIPVTFSIMNAIWDYFRLSFSTNETIFIQKSECDTMAEPTFLTIVLVLIIAVAFTVLLVKGVELIALKIRQ